MVSGHTKTGPAPEGARPAEVVNLSQKGLMASEAWSPWRGSHAHGIYSPATEGDVVAREASEQHCFVVDKVFPSVNICELG